MTRVLQWDGCFNVRDLGGVPLESGGETRRGALIRADNVRKLSAAGWRSVAAHGVTRIVDLRWREELAEDPPRTLDIEVVHVSLLRELDPNFRDNIDDYIAADDPAGYWASSYISMLEEYRQNFARALAAIADGRGPVVFHCAGGKDRTGLVAALLLRLAGASIEEVALDYSLTFEMRAKETPRRREGATDEVVLRRRTFMQNTPPEAMRRALMDIEKRYGGVAGYLTQAGLEDVRLTRLRGMLGVAAA